jgi:hypothetical protein
MPSVLFEVMVSVVVVVVVVVHEHPVLPPVLGPGGGGHFGHPTGHFGDIIEHRLLAPRAHRRADSSGIGIPSCSIMETLQYYGNVAVLWKRCSIMETRCSRVPVCK